MRAEKALLRVDRNYEKFARNMAMVKNSMDRASFLYNGGLAEGEAKSKLDIARKMKHAGKPSVEIGEFTGLSSEEIARL